MYAQFEPLTTSEIFNTNCLENIITVMQSDHPPPLNWKKKPPNKQKHHLVDSEYSDWWWIGVVYIICFNKAYINLSYRSYRRFFKYLIIETI